MKPNTSLTITSVLTILLTILHLADDYSRGFSPGGLNNLPVAPVLAVWLYATLVAVERRSGQVVILVMSILAAGLPVLHLSGKSGITGGADPESAGALFFAWTLLALGTTALVSVILAGRGLWSLRRANPAMNRAQGPDE